MDLKKARSICVMGGTFDPIHYGHLVTAEAVRYEYGIEHVLFMPTGHPPHKENNEVSNSQHRYLMAVLATASNPYFDVSMIEMNRGGYTYTIDTIHELHEICSPTTEIYFITGADAVSQIITWKDAGELLKLCTFIAVTRPGYNKEKLFHRVQALKDNYASRIHFLEVPALAISSSDIRMRVQQGMPIKYLLPKTVEEYIYKYKLYDK